jgi:hypothetical protein
MRTRSTWQGNGAANPRQAATHRQADIYKMNQEHPDAKPTDYESGDPDSWAESWHGYGDVEQEYEGGHVKRNELNFAELLDNTYKHKDSDHWHSGKGNYDNVKDGEGKFENPSGKSQGEKAGRTYETASAKPAVAGDRRNMAEQKARAVERITRAMLRTSNDKLVEHIAVGFMGMPDRLIVATLRALDAVSPDALTLENKTRRAMACTKLAARLIGDDASDKSLEQLASTLMTVDDPTLKSILKQVAASRVAQQQGEEQGEEEGQQQAKTGQQQVTGQQEQQGQQQQGQQDQQGQQQQMSQQEQQAQQEQAQQRFMQQQQQGQQQQDQQGQQQQMYGQQQQQGQQQQGQEQEEQEQQGMPHMGHDLPPAELQMLDQMLKEEMGQQGVPAADDLTSLFEAAPAPAAPVAPVMASAPGATPEISFDDDDEAPAAPAGVAAAQVAAQGDELDNLFGDNEEVQAQRQIKAAEQEQIAREGGFAGVGRTASAKGAKKIGQVQRGKPATVDQALENLWDRP